MEPELPLTQPRYARILSDDCGASCQSITCPRSEDNLTLEMYSRSHQRSHHQTGYHATIIHGIEYGKIEINW